MHELLCIYDLITQAFSSPSNHNAETDQGFSGSGRMTSEL